jgi:hypothetical protein
MTKIQKQAVAMFNSDCQRVLVSLIGGGDGEEPTRNFVDNHELTLWRRYQCVVRALVRRKTGRIISIPRFIQDEPGLSELQRKLLADIYGQQGWWAACVEEGWSFMSDLGFAVEYDLSEDRISRQIHFFCGAGYVECHRQGSRRLIRIVPERFQTLQGPPSVQEPIQNQRPEKRDDWSWGPSSPGHRSLPLEENTGSALRKRLMKTISNTRKQAASDDGQAD